VFTVPAIEKGRYYSLQFIDMYTFNFAYVGSRATGNGAGSYLLAGPKWKGEKPKGIKSVIRSETEFAFVLYRTQLFNPGDIDNVKKIQAGYKVQTLSDFLGKPAPPAPPAVDFIKPLTAEQERTSPQFFKELNFILQFCPTNPAEKALMARFAKLDIGAGKSFDEKALSPELRKAVEDGVADAWKAFADYKTTQLDTDKKTSADGFGTRAFLHGDYMSRFASAVLGIYGNSKDEAIYPVYFVDAGKQRLDGAIRYTLRFAPGQLPPVNAFHDVRIAGEPALCQSAQPLPDQFADAVEPQARRRRPDHAVRPERVSRCGQGTELAARTEGLVLRGDAALLAQAGGAERQMDGTTAATGELRKDQTMKIKSTIAVLAISFASIGAVRAQSAAPPSGEKTVAVGVDNFIRAESDLYFGGILKDGGAIGKFQHRREPAGIDNQTVIRLNRDTLYSSAVFDLDAGPVTIAMPDAGKRFMSLMIVNEDHYVPSVTYDAGPHTFTKDKIGTRYMAAAVRTLVDPANPKDVQEVHALQDAIKVSQKSAGKFEIPSWDPGSQKKVRDALLVLGSTIPDFKKAFGTKAEVDPIRHLIGTAVGWGGNPDKDATYLNVTPAKNDGTTVYRLNVKDVPVNGFWSVSVYDAEGYYEKNPYNAYSLNNITAQKNADGSITIQFGGCDGKIPNCIPIMKGWNYTVRLYRPRPEILSGKWKFPEPQPAG
jgi:hypothetical protein